MTAPPMPNAFRGRVSIFCGTCGLCGREVKWAPPFQRVHSAKRHLRILRWTHLESVGWVCPCRHQYGNLPPEIGSSRKRPRLPSLTKRARVRMYVKRRRRQEVE